MDRRGQEVKVTDPGRRHAARRQVTFSMDAGLLKDTYELAYNWAPDGMSVSWTLVSGAAAEGPAGLVRPQADGRAPR